MDWRRLFNRFSTKKVIVYADFIDPFSYIGFENLRRAAGDSGALAWRGFEYNPDTPETGYRLETADNSDLRAGMWASVRGFAERSGIRIREPQCVFSTRRAHLLLLSVPAGPQKNLLISRLYQAYFNESLDLSRSEVLVEIAHGFGFSKVWTLQALARGNPKRLEDFRNEAKAHAFPGLPGFLYAGKKHFGALPQKTWDAILKTPKGAVHV